VSRGERPPPTPSTGGGEEKETSPQPSPPPTIISTTLNASLRNLGGGGEGAGNCPENCVNDKRYMHLSNTV